MGNKLFATLVTLAACSASAQTTLAPPEQRIADSVIQSDHRVYEALQARIKGINDKGRPVRDYHLSKAQCWLDVSLHEYTRNDRSAFPQAALAESEKLITLMEAAASPAPLSGPWETPLVNDAVTLRPDLWARAAALKKHSGFACATQRTACAEVELVHAGNEHNQQQWRHAKPYVQIAEDQLLEAERAAQACLPPPVALAPVVTPAPEASKTVQLAASVVFDFDKHTAAHMRAAGRAELDTLVSGLKNGVNVNSVKLTGHADRLNSTGQKNYNQQLSQKRANTVREYLVARGVDPTLISFEYRGDTEPVAACDGPFKTKQALQECLLPNRRVQVQLSGSR